MGVGYILVRYAIKVQGEPSAVTVAQEEERGRAL